jgi:hypothetical protein
MNGATRAAARRHYDAALVLPDADLAAELRMMAIGGPDGTRPSKRIGLLFAAADRLAPGTPGTMPLALAP